MEHAHDLKSSGKFAWVLVLGLGLMSAGTTGSYSVVAGCFMTPVCDDLGIDYNMFSYYFTATLVGIAVAMMFVGKILPKVVGRWTHVAVAVVLLAAGAAMAFYSNVWLFLLSGLVIGFGMSFTTGLCMSAVIDQWFRKKAGLAIGLAWAVNSVYMVVMSPVITAVIESVGWRNGYLVLAAVSAVLVIPSIMFIIRFKPSDKGMLPYGYGEESDAAEEGGAEVAATRGVPFRMAVKSPAFIACVLFLCFVQITVCMNQLFPTYAVEVGLGAMTGSIMVSSASLFDIFLNPAVGSACDKLGSFKALVLWTVVSIVSFVMLICSAGVPWLAIVGAGVNDVMYVVAGSGLTCLLMSVFGSRDYGRIFGIVCGVAYIAGAFGMPIMTAVYSATGTFNAVFGLCIAMNVAIIALLFVIKATSKKLQWVEGEDEKPVALG
ncbi:MFS transporter [Rubneribacter badeniensis]|uniref:MFS transporter n=1 Tax=Rubneribacter badeniensis TaxID=2070688 RepID=A0A2K2U1W4_9ACTN|nr:MFS transporter [Rubneribacter badeniensis]PNV64305.1 MFS transporter [Rubneribacter badeniensis]